MALGVSRERFYEWLRRPPSHSSRESPQMLALVRGSFGQSDWTYCSPRVWRDLRAQNLL
jgi:putative transposase